MRVASIMIFVVICFVGTQAFCGVNDPDSGAYVYEKIQTVDMKKAEIISLLTAYIAEKFVSAKSVIQLRDSGLGKIVGDVILWSKDAGFFDAFQGIKARLVIDSKDGKYRIQFMNIHGVNSRGMTTAFSEFEGANRYRIEPMAKTIMDDFSNELQTYLEKTKTTSNW
ncbi:DUF4468 domain-containing protein [Trichlorobacter lovleyi]|uniref:DUF4468 domain-containing protein n=1 Tax=Trichlorobacter lovleyi TaxID=313985 RepID=UPI0023F3DAE9|nr:DUF4468 domain-containing protein [Trichlorobacter lovleyi]